MNQITVYQTDEDGAFLHPIIANELAQSPGVYNVPFGAKLTAPPDAPEGYVAVAVSEDWTTVEDHRQDTLYLVESGEPYALKTTIALNGSAVRYTGLGAIPDWLTLDAPASEEPEQNTGTTDPDENTE